jgi:glycosyltransferase involved in cell wall biosynthesis
MGAPPMTKYIIITPAKNEAGYIEQTINSIKAQTLQPKKWVIVNDGSSDGTRSIVEHYMADYDRIVLVNKTKASAKRRRGQGVIEAFYEGYNVCANEDHDYVVKLDSDLYIHNDYFQKIFERFENDPKLGIASGVSYIQKDGSWTPEWDKTKGFTFGESKVYRRQCFEQIGGLVPYMGWDGIDHIKAVMLGWKASSFEDLIFYHLRHEGRGTGLIKSSYEEGVCCYFMGYHPLFFVARCLNMMLRSPFILRGTAMFAGYCLSAIKRKERLNDRQLIAFLRKNQIKRLLLMEKEFIVNEC